MLFAYQAQGAKLQRLEADQPLDGAVWIDLYRPLSSQVKAAQAFGIEVPTLAEMEEIEVSNRLYRENGIDYITVVLPGLSDTKEAMSGPVTFVITPERLFTVRHHDPRPFTTYPERADRVGPGIADSGQAFLSLIEEIIGRLADLLESSGRALDTLAREVYSDTGTTDADQLQAALRRTGREGEQIARVRLSLLTIERAISYFGQSLTDEHRGTALKAPVKGLMRDIHALEVHADHLSSRVALASDSTMGMINLSQNQTIKIVSIVAVVFLPPTVIASAYGMNFEVMPELKWVWGYPMALGLMVASAVGTYLFFKWRRWL
ncbi:MAG: magnesium transporter CorA family protein [Rhodobacteraceae bacterium]|nr:magnesium transporter CorA family protein [Paracoccaceae bacterium]